MEKEQTSKLNRDFRIYLGEITMKNLVIKLLASILIISYFVFSDFAIRHNIKSFYTRIPPLVTGLLLLVFHLFTLKKYYLFKTEFYNIFLVSAAIMMYSKCLLHLHNSGLYTAISGTILVVSLISIEMKAKMLYSSILYFLPALIFTLILIFDFEVSREEYYNLTNIYPIIILGFIINRAQYKMHFKVFESNYLLNEEKEKTEQLYQETLVMNEDLRQKNEEIITQRDKIIEKKAEIEAQHSHIQESINYAKHIQEAMLPAADIFEKNFDDYFIFYKPRDVVSGDFYWARKNENTLMYAVADCTGHGVPGAMVSMLAISLVDKITTQVTDIKASDVLEQMRKEVKKAFKQTAEIENVAKDGMDIALCIVDLNSKLLQFSGAFISLYIFRDNELLKIKADRQPIGIYAKEKNFTNHEFQLQKNDILYSFSDGFSDQFNEEREKYSIKRFRELLKNNAKKEMNEQKIILENTFTSWKATNNQIDDIVVVGVKI